MATIWFVIRRHRESHLLTISNNKLHSQPHLVWWQRHCSNGLRARMGAFWIFQQIQHNRPNSKLVNLVFAIKFSTPEVWWNDAQDSSLAEFRTVKRSIISLVITKRTIFFRLLFFLRISSYYDSLHVAPHSCGGNFRWRSRKSTPEMQLFCTPVNHNCHLFVFSFFSFPAISFSWKYGNYSRAWGCRKSDMKFSIWSHRGHQRLSKNLVLQAQTPEVA